MVEELLKKVSNSGGYAVLKALKDSEKRWTDLVNQLGIDKSTIWRRLNDFEKSYLVEAIYDRKLKAPLYKLTPLGLKILEKLEEIEKVYEEEMKKVPPKEPEEFLKGGEGERS